MNTSAKRRPPAKRPTNRRPGQRSSTPFVIGAVVVAVVFALVLAVLVAGGESDGDDTASTGAPAVVVGGGALPELPSGGNDPAVGMDMPTLTGASQDDGTAMTIGRSGQAQLILYVAHWCPHCQNEVPVVQDWVDGGNLPDDVELVTVSTAIDATRPNYPPEEWLADEDWSSPVLVDPTGTAAQASGLSAYPFFVAVDADGKVVSRASGELGSDQLDQIAGSLSGGTGS